MEPKLAIEAVGKVFPAGTGQTAALNDINLTVAGREFLSIIGPSGCGKTTLLRCIAGLEQPDTGTIRLNGRAVLEPGPERMMVFQGFEQLFPWLSVRGNVLFPLRLAKKGRTNGERREIADRYLALVGLLEQANAYPYQLSGGQKQRVAIARALSLEPEVLLMDEPFGSLDAITRTSLQQEIARIWQETQSTIIFVTHNLEEAITLADRIVVFSRGRIRAVVPNPLPRPRTPEQPAFGPLWEHLHFLLETNASPPAETMPASPITNAGLVY